MEWFEKQKEEITARLKSTQFFNHLTPNEKKAALSGNHLMFISRTAGAQEAGLDKATFKFFWNYFSQYTHVFSMQFYRVEANSRGTGLYNEFDAKALTMAMDFSRECVVNSTDLLTDEFPDIRTLRKGLLSQFSPGPKLNSTLPRILKRFRQ